jgi:hypothetical protein
MNEQELKEKLQAKYLKKNNQYKQAVSLLNELVGVNKMLQSELESIFSILKSERKSYAELEKSYTELEKSYTELESIVIISPEEIKQAEKSIEDTKSLLLSISSMNY